MAFFNIFALFGPFTARYNDPGIIEFFDHFDHKTIYFKVFENLLKGPFQPLWNVPNGRLFQPHNLKNK